MKEKKHAGIVLLQNKHFKSKGLVRWLPTSDGVGSIFHQGGRAFLRAVLWRSGNHKRIPLYDQVVIVEDIGVIVVCKIGDRIGLIQNFRMVGERIQYGPEYVKKLNSENRWSSLMEKLGEWRWELPRGIVSSFQCEENEDFVLESAKIEAVQEAGFYLADARIRGRINPNSTFFVHSQWVVESQISVLGESKLEDLELIGTVKFFTPSQIRELVKNGELDDGLTLGALALCGIHF